MRAFRCVIAQIGHVCGSYGNDLVPRSSEAVYIRFCGRVIVAGRCANSQPCIVRFSVATQAGNSGSVIPRTVNADKRSCAVMHSNAWRRQQKIRLHGSTSVHVTVDFQTPSDRPTGLVQLLAKRGLDKRHNLCRCNCTDILFVTHTVTPFNWHPR